MIHFFRQSVMPLERGGFGRAGEDEETGSGRSSIQDLVFALPLLEPAWPGSPPRCS
jgi:hypothetical protein